LTIKAYSRWDNPLSWSAH